MSIEDNINKATAHKWETSPARPQRIVMPHACGLTAYELQEIARSQGLEHPENHITTFSDNTLRVAVNGSQALEIFAGLGVEFTGSSAYLPKDKNL